MKKVIIGFLAAAIMVLGGGQAASAAGPIKASFAAPMSLADGCSTTVTRQAATVGPQTVARCTGGYQGRIGYYRAKQDCHFGFWTTTQYGGWAMIRSGTFSQTAPCNGIWMDGSGYQLR